MKNNSAYKQAVNYLLEQLPMFQRLGAAAYRSDLTNIIKLCDILGNPQKDLKCIHIAGTNGKGSVTHIIASVLQQQGYKVGVFVSPHYKDYRERIKINGQYISKKFVTAFVEENKEKFKDIQASFFEISTAMAFEYFKQKLVDFAVIETGMGGRLDSTNIITPLLSVITNISFDHQQFLGNTLPLIATEKAGIIKPGIPVVIGETQKETQAVFSIKARATKSPIWFADKELKGLRFKTDLQGSYQQKNVPTALMAIEVLKQSGVKVSDKAITKGLKNVARNTAFIGRWMIMGKKPLLIFDSAHNQAGIKEVAKNLSKLSFNKMHFVYGTVADKDIAPVLKLLPKNATYYFCKANIPRGLNAGELKQQAAGFKLMGEAYPSVNKALKAALKAAGNKDLVLVSGSVFVVAEAI
jgi:dihydrofolate synthase/folylpolyglutamate synthase